MSKRFDASLSALGCKVQRQDGASLRLDSTGRWNTARVDGAMFHRTLACDAVRLSGSSATLVDAPETHERVATLALQFLDAIAKQPNLVTLSADSERAGVSALQQMLLLASRWSVSNYAEEATRFRNAYPETVEILPPDRYGDLVLLPALGCPNSQCSFCAFYKERRFRLLDDQEFAQHIEAVCSLLGESVEARQGIFLGSASALSLSQRILCKRLKLVAARLGTRRRGIGAFWDPDHCPKRTVGEWQELRDLGLRSAYLGLETGLSDLRATVGKSSNIAALVTKTDQARQAGVQIGVMVLAGIAEEHRQDAHCAATAAVVESMHLSTKDIIFISPVLGTRPEAMLNAEASRLRTTIGAKTQAKVAPYAAHRFHYYA